jgi:Ca2+-binding EF-hand superfamily protein
MKQAIDGGKSSGLDVDNIFKTLDDNGSGHLDITEFNELVSLCFK